MTPRATPMAPEERRAAILAAVVPVVLERGPAATTRELAHAAGVAEGTLFRVFESKDELLVEAARTVFAETQHLDALAAIDPGWPLEGKLREVVSIWQGQVRRIIGVYLSFAAAGGHERLGDPRQAIGPDVVRETDRLVTGLLAPHAHELRLPIAEVTRIVGGLVMMTVHPGDVGVPLTPTDVVDLLLHGVLAAPTAENGLTLTPREPAGSTAYPIR